MTDLARPNPVWAALEENPLVVLSVAGGLILAAVGMALMRKVEPRRRQAVDLDPDLP